MSEATRHAEAIIERDKHLSAEIDKFLDDIVDAERAIAYLDDFDGSEDEESSAEAFGECVLTEGDVIEHAMSLVTGREQVSMPEDEGGESAFVLALDRPHNLKMGRNSKGEFFFTAADDGGSVKTLIADDAHVNASEWFWDVASGEPCPDPDA